MRNSFASVVCANARPPSTTVVNANAPAPSMKPRRLVAENRTSDSPQQEHPRECGSRNSVISRPPVIFLLARPILSVEDGHRPGPARGGALDLHREARHREAGRGQLLE